VAGYSGDAGDALIEPKYPTHIANGKLFSTPDSDNDVWADDNCAAGYGGGWWYGMCSTNNINTNAHMIWTTDEPVFDVQASRMLLKLN